MNKTSCGGGLFGNNNGSNNASGGLFGNKPASGGLFGNNNNNGIGFGANGGTNNTGGGLFGNKTQTSGGSLFGNNKPSFGFGSSNNGGGLFGNNQQNSAQANGGFGFGNNQQQQQQQQQQLVALSNQNPYGVGPLFAATQNMVQPVVPPSIMPMAKPLIVKKDVSLTAAYKIAPKPLFSPKNSVAVKKGSIVAPAIPALPAPNTKSSSTSANTTLLEDGNDVSVIERSGLASDETDEAILSSYIFAPTKNAIKLIIDSNKDKKKFNGLKDESAHTKRVSFQVDNVDDEISLTSEKKVADKKEQPLALSSPPAHKTGSVKTQKQSVKLPADYYITPTVADIDKMSPEELTEVQNFTVGKKGYGEVKFLQPVDLTSISLSNLANIVIFGKQQVLLYPNIDARPKQGEGLNKRAQFSIEGCFPQSKDGKTQITDPHHPLVKKHIRKLHAIPNTDFQSYDPITGTWVFICDHV